MLPPSESTVAEFQSEMTHAIAAAFAGPPPSSIRNRTVPFADLYAPIAALARRKIRTDTPSLASWMLDARAWRGLELHLLHRISDICSLALLPRFQAFKSACVTFGKTPDPSLYQSFANEQGADGLRDFFGRFPVAARLTAQVSLFWIDAVTEFLARLDADADAIGTRFFARRPPGKIVSIRAGMSDPHHGGRSVWIVGFEHGRGLVYKPRPMEIDAAFFDVLRWLNGTDPRRAPLPTLEVLCRENYGWQTHVEPASCRTRREAKQWYRRAGALLCLLHAARGVDVHCENLIATAKGPVIVDLEGLVHPPSGGLDPLLDKSVLRTGMLPLRGYDADGRRAVSRNALDAPVRQRSARDELLWKHINTDRMQAVLAPARHPYPAHRARLGGALLSARRHADELVEGFRAMARRLMDDAPLAREWASRAARMARLPTRHIRRPTFLYLTLIRGSLQPHLLTSETARARAWQAIPSVQPDAEEVAAMERLDVPHFRRESPEGGAAAGVAPLTSEDVALQISLIRKSMRGRLTLHRGRVRRASDTNGADEDPSSGGC